jgi:hypothetical protein
LVNTGNLDFVAIGKTFFSRPVNFGQKYDERLLPVRKELHVQFMHEYWTFDSLLQNATTGCIKKLNRFEIALNFAKQLLVSSF